MRVILPRGVIPALGMLFLTPLGQRLTQSREEHKGGVGSAKARRERKREIL